VRKLMLDSGCSSLLLPITSDADRNQLVTLFGNRALYNWSVGTGGNAGPMSSCVLTIRRVSGRFEVSLCNSTPTPYNVTLRRLRFGVSFVDAQAFIVLHNNNTLAIAGVASLHSFVANVNVLIAGIEGVVVGQRKDHALIGQAILYGKFVFESGDLAMVCETQAQVPPQIEHANYLNLCDVWIAAEFNQAPGDFDFMDDDHGDPLEIDEDDD